MKLKDSLCNLKAYGNYNIKIVGKDNCEIQFNDKEKKKNENIISVNEHKMKHTILVENQMKDCCLFYGIF